MEEIRGVSALCLVVLGLFSALSEHRFFMGAECGALPGLPPVGIGSFAGALCSAGEGKPELLVCCLDPGPGLPVGQEGAMVLPGLCYTGATYGSAGTCSVNAVTRLLLGIESS